MGIRPPRRNGFQLPRSGDQKTIMIAYPLVTLVFVGFLVWLEYSDVLTLLTLLLPYLVVVAVVLSNWYMVESVDPVDRKDTHGEQLDPGIRIVCFHKSSIKTRYCGSCRKHVYGLDHHCTWLNTCVGARNYAYFFSLVFSGTFQMLYQSILTVLYMTLWRSDTPSVPSSETGLIIFFSLVTFFGFVCCVLTVAFGVLLVFHLYLLLWIRAGSYEWMMGGRRGDYNERAWSRSQKEQYESGYRQQASSTSGTEVRHGRITETGDIEFSEIRGVEEDSLNLDRESASGDDVSESLASSRGTEVLNDPDCENNGYIENHATPTDTAGCNMDHDPNVPVRRIQEFENSSPSYYISECVADDDIADGENI